MNDDEQEARIRMLTAMIVTLLLLTALATALSFLMA